MPKDAPITMGQFMLFLVGLVLLGVVVLWHPSGEPGEPGTPPHSYRDLPLRQVIGTIYTHVCTTGTVSVVRREADRDWHLKLEDGNSWIIAEIIPEIPLQVPTVGQRIRACGNTRQDRQHRVPRYPGGWFELHPLRFWEPIGGRPLVREP